MSKLALACTNAGSENHHNSHRDLLAVPECSDSAQVDAIIVPTARRAAAMRHAIRVAADLRCALIVLCSRFSTRRKVMEEAWRWDVELIAIDVDAMPSGLLPRFRTSELVRSTRFDRGTDTSAKRNLGILVAGMCGWRRAVFLDDDIVVPEPDDLTKAVGLTDRYAGVGLAIGGYPDNSVVCHAYRQAGGPQDMFIGGGALAIGIDSTTSFFPNIYNEDWFFLLDGERLRPTAVTGQVVQKPYDPFARDERARMEEFGDCLAEGLFWLLDEGRSVRDADVAYWRMFLKRRAEFISEVTDMVRQMPGDRHRMLSSLAAARGRCLTIEPELCAEYVRAWQADRKLWHAHLEHFRLGKGLRHPAKVLARLGLTLHADYVAAGS